MKNVFTNGMMLLAVALSFGITTNAQRVLGGYKPAKTDDARVVAAAEFAVSDRAEKNAEQEGLTLDLVDKAETQVVAGTNYRLCLTVKLEDETQQIEAVVYQNLKQAYSLTSWTIKDCADNESEAAGENLLVMQNANYNPPLQTATPVCKGEQLSLSETEGEADIGGKQYAKFLLTNVSKSACILSGYPTISLLNGKGQPVPRVKVIYNDWRFNGGEVPNSPPEVTLEPSKTAWFQIFYTDGMIAANLKKPAPASAKIKVKAPRTDKDFIIDKVLHAYKEIEVSYLHEGLPD